MTLHTSGDIADLSDTQRAQISDRWNTHHAVRYLGASVDLTDPDVVRLTVDPIESHHRGGLGTDAVNGVVMAGVFDLTIGLVAHLAALQRRVGTVQLNIQYIRPVHGDRFEVEGRLVRCGRKLSFGTADLLNQDKTLCARCDGMAAIVGETPSELIAL